eukprot:890158-Alexandrium_andersonii.AAC.1
MAGSESCSCIISPSDPTSHKPAGGVATLASDAMKLAEVAPETGDYRRHRDLGRVQCCIIDSGQGYPIRIFNIYGWTGGEEKTDARGKT